LSIAGPLRRRLLGLAAVALAVTAAACSSGGSGGSGDDEARGALPPNNKASIEQVFSRRLDELGLRLTRGALVDLRTGKVSPRGTHLAVYVEPVGPFSADDYARQIVAVTKVFAPRSFDTWRGLTSFDVCQEPLQSLDTRPEPPPKTKVNMTRKASGEVGWRDLDLPQLLTDAKRLGTRELSVYAEPEVRRTTMYQDAVVKAQAAVPSTNPPPPPPPSAPSYRR
jgi:hypothetical protein